MSRVKEGGRRAVFKVGFEATQDKALPVIRRLWTPQSEFVVVHGGGKPATQRSEQLGLPVRKTDEGQRITDERTLKEAIIPVFTDINIKVAQQLRDLGIEKTHEFRASHPRNTLLFAFRDDELGYVAQQPIVHPDILEEMYRLHITPVVAPLSRDIVDGHVLNTNGDKAAAAFPGDAFFVSTPEGVLNKSGVLFPELTRDMAEDLIKQKVIKDGMIVKVNSALTAAETRKRNGSGDSVYITNSDGALDIFDGRTAGTLVVAKG